MLFEDTYFTIKTPETAELRERGSRFIGLSYPVKSEEEVKTLLQKVKKEHPQANHHCYAYRLTTDPTVFRFSDDREPSGSAGKPILGAIQSKGLTDILIVVVRYFGGTLLGVPGLIAAYRATALKVIESSIIVEKTINDRFVLTFPYELVNEVHQLLKSHPIEIRSQEYGEPCNIVFDIRRKLSDDFRKKFNEHPRLSYLSTLAITQHATS